MLRPLLVSCLLLFALPFVPASTAQTVPGAQDLVIDDARGDIMGPLSENDGPYAFADVERLIVGRETQDEFSIVFDLGPRPEPATTVGEAAAVTDTHCQANFRYDGRNDHRYWLNVFADDLLGPGDAPSETRGYMYQDIYTEDYGAFNYYTADAGDFTVAWDATENALVVTLPKTVATHPEGHAPSDGVTLELSSAMCRTTIGILTVADSMQTDDQRFRFRAMGPGEVVSVRFGDHVTTTEPESDGEVFYYGGPSRGTFDVALAAGEVNVVPLTLQNKVDAKRIVSLSARAHVDGKTLPWNVSVAPTVALNSEETRLVKLIVVPPADAEPGLEPTLEVSLSVLGADAPGIASHVATVVPILAPGLDTYRFFTQPGGESPTERVVMGLFERPPRVTMSLLASPEGWTQEPVQATALLNGYGYFQRLDALARPARLDVDGDIVLTLQFSSDQPGNVAVYFYLNIGDQTVIYVNEVVPTGEVVEIRRAVTSEVDLPEGSRVSFSLGIENDFPEMPVNTMFLPASSSLKLPLVTPPAQELNVTDGRFLPTLSLAPGEERETYINPGGIHTFELVVANEGVETDDLSIHVTNEDTNSTGWALDVKPGSAFRIPAGNATRFGVEVRAPESAAEGELADLLVEAVSKHDPAAKARFRLKAIATTTLQFEDKRYEAGEDQIPALPPERKEAPMAALPLAFLGVGMVAWVWRRRAGASR